MKSHFMQMCILGAYLLCNAAASVFSQSAQPIVSHITAHYDAQTASIVLSWDVPEQLDSIPNENHISKLNVFRSTAPITTSVDIASLTPIATLEKTQTTFTDSVPSYNDYYYAVIAVTTSGPYAIVLPSINTTVTGVHKIKNAQPAQITQVPKTIKEYPAGTKREIPLPMPDILDNQNYTPLQMDPHALAQAQSLGKKSEPKALLIPYAFEEDMIAPAGGDEYILFTILHETFARKKYRDAIARLEDFLASNHSKALTERAYFYLGECHYFAKQYEKAIVIFLKTQNTYPDLSQEWIYASLDSINISD